MKTALMAALLISVSTNAMAQTTPSFSSQINSTFPDNTSGQITPAGVRSYETSLVNLFGNKQDYPAVTQSVGNNSTAVATTAFIAQGIQTQGTQISINPYTPPTTIPGNQPFSVLETVSGTCTTGTSPCRYNLVDILSDTAIVGSGTSGTFTNGLGFEVIHNIGGVAMTGNRSAGSFNLLMNSTTGNTAQGVSYSGINAVALVSASDNGTSTTKANARGQIQTANFIAHLTPTVSNWYVMTAGEVDVIAESGSSVYYKAGWLIVQESNDAVQGTGEDSALIIGNQSGAVGWTTGIKYGGSLGVWPFTSSAVIETCTSPCGSAATFIDMSAATFSTAFLKGPGFTVNGTGQITSGSSGGSSGSLTLNGSTSGSSSVVVNSTGALVVTGALAIDGTTPTSCTVSGAGSSATCSFSGNSNSSSGTALIASAGTGQAATGTLVINFAQTLPGASVPVCIGGYNNVSTAWSTTAVPLQINVSSTTAVTFAWNNGTGNALVAGDTYRVDYHCFGK